MRIDFIRLRFLIAFIFLFAAALKYYQLITEPIPPTVQDSFFTPILELLNERYFVWFVIEFELCFGLFLLSGVLLNYFWFLSWLCFLFFSSISFVKWFSGEMSCGCFGTISVNPLYTAIFDLTIATVIILFRGQIDTSYYKSKRDENVNACLPPDKQTALNENLSTHSLRISELLKRKFRITFSGLDKIKSAVVIAIWIILSLPATLLYFSIEVHYDQLGERTILPNGREMITLNPQNWQNKKFPLTQHLQKPYNESVELKNIHTIILVHADCLRCQKLIVELENQKNNNTILIELPTKIKSAKIQTKLPILKLNEKRDWFAITPCKINLQDGCCVTINQD
jgi:hypothetical protein